MTGQTISHYRVLNKLGEGGMGVVYKAEDTKLHRSVALKFLRRDAVENRELRSRFLTEAEAAAALVHPNVCVVHEVDECDGQPFIAMEYVEGQNLSQKISGRPLPLDEALGLATQIADGLEVAHRKGIVHRDIKSGNVLLDEAGRAKIVDFGLAHLEEATRITKTGTVMGTPAYMSPEQIRGEVVDQRADIWALGVVLYEMVTGRLPFAPDRVDGMAMAILGEDAKPLTALRTGVPVQLDWIVAKALAKAPEERYQHVEEMRVDLRRARRQLESGQTEVLSRAAERPEMRPGRRGDSWFPWLVAAAATAALLVLGVAHFSEGQTDVPLRKLGLSFPVAIAPGLEVHSMAISPNGKQIAVASAGEGLWLQDLESGQVRPIDGTEEARAPFWSPDSLFVGFHVGRTVMKLSTAGGSVTQLCESDRNTWDGTWSPDGELIVFNSGGSLAQVPARGGPPRPVITREELEADPGLSGYLSAPHFLPAGIGSRVLVFGVGTWVGHTLVAVDLETDRRVVVGNGSRPIYSPSGHLVYQTSFSDHELWAMPFDLKRLKATGEQFPLTQGGWDASVSADQTLVYLDGSVTRNSQLVWVDRAGRRVEEIGGPRLSLEYPALSPDGRLLAFSATEEGIRDIWVHDLERRTRTRLSTAAEAEAGPVWSSTGNSIAYSAFPQGQYDVVVQGTEGGGERTLVGEKDVSEVVNAWHDGYLFYSRSDPKTSADIWYLEVDEEGGKGEAHTFLQTPFVEREAVLSPDGRHLAYVSNESGRSEVYVQVFPEGGPNRLVSTDGGTQPRWSRDGRELFYVAGRTMMAVPVSLSPKLTLGTPATLFEHPDLGRRSGAFAQYDVSLDGRRFVLTEKLEAESGGAVIRLVQNWYAEFREQR